MLDRFHKDEFKKRLRGICDIAFSNAKGEIPSLNPTDTTSTEYRNHQQAVFEDWKEAQYCIFQELSQIAQWRSESQRRLKEYRRARKTDVASATASFIHVLDDQEAILRAVANSLVWMMYQSRRWLVRRLWADSPPVPLTSINPKSLEIANSINDDPNAVAILTDITSIANIGDIVVVHADTPNPEPELIEVKDGSVNESIMSVIHEHGEDFAQMPAVVLAEIREKFGNEGIGQLKRVSRQVMRTDNYNNFVNSDTGRDPVTGTILHLIGPAAMDNYDISLAEMISTATTTAPSISLIDGCLWLGVYRLVSEPDSCIKEFLQTIRRRGASSNFAVWNLAASIMDPTIQPVFLRALESDSIIDIVLGDIQVLAYIDWDAFLNSAIQSGISARWTTRRERREQSVAYRQDLAFRLDGHTPHFEKGDYKIGLMGGMAAQVAYEGVSPSSLLQLIQDELESEARFEEAVHREASH